MAGSADKLLRQPGGSDKGILGNAAGVPFVHLPIPCELSAVPARVACGRMHTTPHFFAFFAEQPTDACMLCRSSESRVGRHRFHESSLPSTRIGFLNSSRPVYPARGSDQIRKDKGQGTKRERHDPSTPSRWHQHVHPLSSRLLLFSFMYLPVVCQIRNGGPHVQSYIVNSHVSFCKGMSSLACVSLAKCDLSSV